MQPAYEPNQWRVISVVEDGVPLADTFYVFRNPPSAVFATEADGRNRRVFRSREEAQAVVDDLNRKQAQ